MIQIGTTWDIFEQFCREPNKEHYLKDLSRKAKVAHTSVARHLQLLLKENVIEKRLEKKGSRIFPLYKAKQNEEFRFYKKIANLMQLQKSGLLETLKDTYAPECIVLFGSYSTGEDGEESDIDLYLQAKPKEISLHRFEKILGRKIQLQIREEFTYAKELKNNILNGITLSGYLEAFS